MNSLVQTGGSSSRARPDALTKPTVGAHKQGLTASPLPAAARVEARLAARTVGLVDIADHARSERRTIKHGNRELSQKCTVKSLDSLRSDAALRRMIGPIHPMSMSCSLRRTP
jgi:hypothetical protein